MGACPPTPDADPVPGAAVAVAVPVAALRAVGRGRRADRRRRHRGRALRRGPPGPRRAQGGGPRTPGCRSPTGTRPAPPSPPACCATPAPSSSARCPYAGATLADPPPGRPHGQVARYATDDHYAALRRALGAIADVLREAGHRAAVVRRRQRPGRPGRRRAGRARLVGQERQRAGARATGSWVVLGRGGHRRRAARSTTPVDDGCGSCRRCLDGCPTGAIVAPGVVDARRCLAWMVQADGPFPVEHRVALGDRIYGCDDCQEVCPPNRRGPEGDRGACRPTGAVGRPARPARRLRRRAAGPPRPLVRAAARPPLPAPQRPGGARQRRPTPGDPEVVRRLDAIWRAGDDDLLAEHAALGRSTASPPADARSEVGRARPGRRREAPARHQRLPAQGRRHPVLPVGAVAPARPPSAPPCSPRPTRAPRRSTPPSRSGSSATGPGGCCPPPPSAAASTGSRPRSTPTSCCSTRRCRSGSLGPRLERPYGVVLHGAEVTVPGRVPGTRRMLARVLRGARLVVAAGGYPAAEASRAAGRDLPTVVVPPGVDTERFHPLDRRRAPGRARRRLGLDPDAPRGRSASAGSCPARASTC